MPVRTLVAWLPDWPVTAAGFGAGEPVAVVHANRVVASSAAARAMGVRRGLRRREAQSRCPDVVVVAADPARDARAFEPVVAALEELTPRVEVVRPGMAAFGTRGPARYFGGEEALAALVADGAGWRVGIADGPFAAEQAARQGERGSIVPRGRAATAAFLAPLPIACLDRSGSGAGEHREAAELVHLFRLLGLRTLGDLAALPAPSVLARFGEAGAAAHRLARGLDERPLAARRPPPDLEVTVELDPPAERVDVAAFAAKALADDLHGRLGALGLACTRLRVDAETEHGERLSRLWRHDGALTAAATAERVRWQLDGWLTAGPASRPTGGISRLWLVPDEVRPDTGRQLGFWGGDLAAAERAGRAFARVQGLLGPDGVVTAVLQGGRDPAERVRLVPWGEPRHAAVPDVGAPDEAPRSARSRATRRDVDGELPVAARPSRRDRRAHRRSRPAPSPTERPAWPGRLPSPSPATVFAEPRPAEVVDDAGRPVGVSGRGLPTAAPARVSVAGGPWADVVAWAGPWPAEERWWDAGAARRRARWQVAIAGGAAYLLVLEAGAWAAEAAYD